MPIDDETVRSMAKAGVRFMVSARVPGGGRDLMLKPAEVEGFLTDRDKAIAAHFGATSAEYHEWVSSDGNVQCAATTTSGHRCKNFLPGGGQMEMDEWKRAKGGYCAVHDGSKG